MVSYVLNVDKAGDLKFGRKKCRLHKKSEVVQVARDYGIPTPNKKTISDLCGRLKKKIQKAERVSREEVKKILANQNNIPLAKLYPEAVKKRVAAKRRAEKKALDKKIAANFMRNMTVKINSPSKPKPKPSKKAKPLTKKEAIKRISAMKGLNREGKFKLKIRVEEGVMSPRRVVKVARELSRLKVPGHRVMA